MNGVELSVNNSEDSIYIELGYDYSKRKPQVEFTVYYDGGEVYFVKLTAEEATMIGEALITAAMEADKK